MLAASLPYWRPCPAIHAARLLLTKPGGSQAAPPTEAVTLHPGGNYPDVTKLAAFIAGSQIVVAGKNCDYWHLPSGFSRIDAAILEWLAAEGRQAHCGPSRM